MPHVTEIDHGTGRVRERSETGRIRSAYETPPRAAAALAAELRNTVAGEVRFDAGSRALYATDAWNYRQVPIGAVVPRSREDVIAIMRACRRAARAIAP